MSQGAKLFALLSVILLACLIAAKVATAGCISTPPPSTGGVTCYAPTNCSDSDDCLASPTSLYAVDTDVAKTQDGWTAGTPCGTQRCMLFLRCCCGRPFGTGLCT